MTNEHTKSKIGIKYELEELFIEKLFDKFNKNSQALPVCFISTGIVVLIRR